MFSDNAKLEPQTTWYPPEVASFVSELTHTDQDAAEMQIWRDLQSKEGAVWHRQSDPMLRGISERLAERLNELRPRQDGYVVVSNEAALDQALQRIVRDSQLVRHEIISSDQASYLEQQYRAMYKLLSLITGDPTVVIDLRIERESAYIENYHRDFGTAFLMTLQGPGTHFVKPNNQPSDHDGAFFRHNLPRPDEVFEVPTCSLLAMRGKPTESEQTTAQGLWHASPCKVWNDTVQWDCRVLLIASSPTSEILPAPPRLTS
jgi:hypothetical protein